MRRRKITAGLNTKLIMDVVFASLIVQKAPAFINRFIPLDPNISKFAGVGAGYITGYLMKRPAISNASLSLGITDFVSPIIDSFISTPMPGLVSSGTVPLISPAEYELPSKFRGKPMISDFVNLNDYVSTPGMDQPYTDYDSIYNN